MFYFQIFLLNIIRLTPPDEKITHSLISLFSPPSLNFSLSKRFHSFKILDASFTYMIIIPLKDNSKAKGTQKRFDK